MAVVVDTNVAMVASHLTPQADERCVAACIKRLIQIQSSGGLLIDAAGHILFEYMKNLGHSGQPGAGHASFPWRSRWRRYGRGDRAARIGDGRLAAGI